jgi:cytosine/adenosine deaminase-related metal-dependent hydrolase
VLEGGTIVMHDSIAARSLTLAGEHVRSACAGAYPIDLRGHFVFPGLVNAHDHLQLNCIPPLPHGAPFANSYEWIDAFEAHRATDAVAEAVRIPTDLRHRHGGLKNLLSGVTLVAHHDPWHAAFDECDFPVSVLSAFGWSHSLRLGGASPVAAPKYGPAVDTSFLTTPSTNPWFIHLAEGVDGVAGGELGVLEDVGCLSQNTVIVHGVGLTHHDIQRVVDSGASVVWCPSSNLGMFGRTLDSTHAFDAGRVGLGTDSRLTGARDLLEELGIAAANSSLTPRALVDLVTIGGAAVLRVPDAGGLQIGQRSDCIIVRDDGDPFETLLRASRSSVRAVVRRSAPVIADRDFAAWFAHCGVDTVAATLDGQPKLIDRRFARPDVVALEPGLEIAQ